MPHGRKHTSDMIKNAHAEPVDNDWSSWIMIAAIFVISTVVVWLPVIMGVGI